ncbi:MAG: general secretion pathway protein GspD [Flavobacteriaceae bacterium]|nr:general secretion pathway protein GspD [Flavobacteriaceae bacterium]
MKKTLIHALLFICFTQILFAQQTDRIATLTEQLEVMAVKHPKLEENVKVNLNVNQISMQSFLLGIAALHELNIHVAPELNSIQVANNFEKVSVKNLLLFLCKEYQLTLEFTGAIIAVKKYVKEEVILPPDPPGVQFDALNGNISFDLQNDPLERVFKEIINISGKNLLFSKAIQEKSLSLYLKNVPFDTAMEQLALVNQMQYTKSADGFYLFDSLDKNQNSNITKFHRERDYTVLDTIQKTLKVNFRNTPIADFIENIGKDLNLNIYYASSLENAGQINFKTNMIHLDALLQKIFEENQGNSQLTNNVSAETLPNNRRNNQRQNPRVQQTTSNSPVYSFKKENNIYYFGTKHQLSIRSIEVVQLMHRSIALWEDPTPGFQSSADNVNERNNRPNNFQNNLSGNNNRPNNNTQPLQLGRQQFNNYSSKAEALVNILPSAVTEDLEITVDYELNSFLVSGPAANIQRFRNFISKIDKPVPYVLIEVMLIEVSKSAVVETGIEWGIGKEPTKTQGGIFPSADITLGANTVNKIIGGFNGFGSLNIGNVIPEFFAKIKAMEESGNIKIKSTPKLSTLNGHRAHLSIGETTYYVVTNQNFYGSQIPQASEIKNYQAINAQLGISIKPIVSGDGQVTLDIHVIQSDFNGKKVDKEAPPGINSREFSSIIRMRDQDVAVLGGLEEKRKNDSGTGVPLLARIPIIKWFFSSKKREDSKRKLTVIIKPTIIY